MHGWDYRVHRWHQDEDDRRSLSQVTQTRSAWGEWVYASNTNTNTNTNSTMTITYDTGAAWNQWVGTTTATMYIVPNSLRVTAATTMSNNGYAVVAPPRDLTEEEIEANRVAMEERQEQRRLRAERAEQAKQRAELLLVSNLDSDQVAELAASNRFHVTSSRGRRYCIKRGRAGNITREDSEGRFTFCIHDYVGLPESDTMLAQKLLLEADEAEFLRIANRTRH